MNADCPHKCTRRPRPPYVADGYAQRPVIGLRKVFGIEETHPFQILSSFLFTLSNHLQKKKSFNKHSLLSSFSPSSYTMAAVTAPKDTPKSGLALYSRFAFAGAVCCSVTHGAVTPLDV